MDNTALLLHRIRSILESKEIVWEEKKMFGGYCFMVDDKMCMGTYRGGLMARCNPIESNALLAQPGANPFAPSGRPMKGYVFIDPIGFESIESLEFWIQKCLEFNPFAKSSKKKK